MAAAEAALVVLVFELVHEHPVFQVAVMVLMIILIMQVPVNLAAAEAAQEVLIYLMVNMENKAAVAHALCTIRR
jgi:hypothetical protein